MKKNSRLLFILFTTIAILAWSTTKSLSQEVSHPNLTVTQQDIEDISAQISNIAKASEALQQLVDKVDAVLAQPMDVPVPKDAGGGYTHEQHKRNYQALYDAGLLFQITKEPAYLEFVKNMLLEYTELYPTLDIHPKHKEQTPGKLFWQSLNEAVWLVHTIQAYDMVVSSLNPEIRQQIETNLLRPAANYLSAGQPETFNKIHNHGTWAVAAVGMTGYVLGDEKLVKQALYGLDMSGDAGFLKQIENLFSPDAYYAEGPYYQRYALMPFVLFAKAIEVNDPDLEIFEFRDQVLLKAIHTTVQLSYNKLFFGINDAIKDKGIDTVELVHGIAIAYEVTKDPQLLSVANLQNHTLLTGYGFKVAKAIEDGLAKPFEYQSMQLRDGKDGDQGALAIFRNGIDYGHQALVMKNTSQGLGHGHFDKLHWLYFDNGREIISDYGAARFLNIEAKYGGHYLPENASWAKQTVAHNTVVVDQTSHFDSDWELAQQSAPDILFFETTDKVKITSASIADAYKGTELKRTMAMIKHDSLEYPLIIDLFKLASESTHQYDLPLHYEGQIISHNLEFSANSKALSQLGEGNGYQHLWDRGRGLFDSPMAQLTWLNEDRFYSYSTLGGKDEEIIFAQLGANDPNFNLLKKSSLIHRVSSAKDHSFLSVLEQHGEYNGRLEYTINAKSSVSALTLNEQDGINIIEIELINGDVISLLFSEDGDQNTKHEIELDDQTVEWVGHHTLL